MSKSVLQPVDDGTRRAAKTFLRSARYGALGTIDPKTGIPMTSRVSLASDAAGHPVFLISQLSGHFGALEVDSRTSLLLGEPGKGDPLAHPRLTVFGTAAKIEGGARQQVRARFLARHPKAQLYVDFGDFAFWHLDVQGASYNGGFGKAYELNPEDLLAPTDSALGAMEQGAVDHMNEDHGDAIAHYARAFAGRNTGKWKLACIDLEGLDLTSDDDVARVWFNPPLDSAEELRPRLVELAKQARDGIEN